MKATLDEKMSHWNLVPAQLSYRMISFLEMGVVTLLLYRPFTLWVLVILSLNCMVFHAISFHLVPVWNFQNKSIFDYVFAELNTLTDLREGFSENFAKFS